MPPPGTDSLPRGKDAPARPERLLAKGRADGGGLMTPDDQSRSNREPLFCHGQARGGRGPREVVQPRTRPESRRRRLHGVYLRKEVIQPQVPLRLPCYDFTPVADPTVDACLPLLG